MTIYIDNDYKCHVSPADGLTPIETDYFNGKCPEWIESYRFVPAGQTWTREDGTAFVGEMIAPWKSLTNAYGAQLRYLEDNSAEIEDMKAALELLGVTDEEDES